jgi:hypothetical protein
MSEGTAASERALAAWIDRAVGRGGMEVAKEVELGEIARESRTG